MKRKDNFTLVELLLVIAIIGIIMAVLLPALSKVRDVGKRTSCLSNLRQIGTAINMYKTDSNMNWVPWTSMLYSRGYLSTTKVYQCPSDLNPPATAANAWLERIDNEHSGAYDRPGNVGIVSNGSRTPENVGNVSYYYEMSDANCNWTFTYTPSGTLVPRDVAGLPNINDTTYAIWKEIQLNHGGDDKNPWGTPYSVSAFPIYRCFWHIKGVSKYSSAPGNLIPNSALPVINITYGGSYVLTKAYWEDGVWNP